MTSTCISIELAHGWPQGASAGLTRAQLAAYLAPIPPEGDRPASGRQDATSAFEAAAAAAIARAGGKPVRLEDVFRGR